MTCKKRLSFIHWAAQHSSNTGFNSLPTKDRSRRKLCKQINTIKCSGALKGTRGNPKGHGIYVRWGRSTGYQEKFYGRSTTRIECLFNVFFFLRVIPWIEGNREIGHSKERMIRGKHYLFRELWWAQYNGTQGEVQKSPEKQEPDHRKPCFSSFIRADWITWHLGILLPTPEKAFSLGGFASKGHRAK